MHKIVHALIFENNTISLEVHALIFENNTIFLEVHA